MITMSDTTDLQSPYLPPDENEMSRRYLRMLEKWIPVGVEYFSEWPERPDCGHFFGGVNAYGIESFVPAEAFAFASLSPDYDEKATGVSRDSGCPLPLFYTRYGSRGVRQAQCRDGTRSFPRHEVGRARRGVLSGEPVRPHGGRHGPDLSDAAESGR